MSGKVAQLESLLRPVVEGLGYELWGLEFLSQGRHSLLRLYIDQPEGIGVGDCEKVSHQVSGVLDVEDPIQSAYTLEVSSPGMDRPLFTPEHFAQHAGERVRLKLRVPFEGRRKFEGLLQGIEGEDVVLLVDQEEYLLPWDGIERANIVPVFDEGKR